MEHLNGTEIPHTVEYKAIAASIAADENVKWNSPFGKHVGSLCLWDSAQEKSEPAHTNTCTRVFIEALFITDPKKKWKRPKCPSAGDKQDIVSSSNCTFSGIRRGNRAVM